MDEPRGYKEWTGVYNNPPDGWKLRFAAALAKADRGAYCLEEGDEKTPHVQYLLCYKSQKRMSTLKEELGGEHHLEKAGSVPKSFDYTLRTGTYAGKPGLLEGPWSKNPPAILETGLEGRELYPYQKEILELCENAPSTDWEKWRAIHWYWSWDGDKGKSSVMRALVDRGDCILVSGTNYGSAVSALADWVAPEKGHPKALRAVIVNLSKDSFPNLKYEILEHIKDCLLSNEKYRCRQVRFGNVHLIVFSNSAPNTDRLSFDRWRITEIG